jgi:hypothetical protein
LDPPSGKIKPYFETIEEGRNDFPFDNYNDQIINSKKMPYPFIYMLMQKNYNGKYQTR